MKYVVLSLKGKQYRVSEGEEFLVDKVGEEKLEPQILLMVDGESVKVGSPVLKNVKLNLKVLNVEEKGEKVDIFKYKSKSRYRKHLGFRPKYTRILLEKIS